VPFNPDVSGVKDVMEGTATHVKALPLVALPPGVVTVILPLVPAPTVATIVVGFFIVNANAGVPPKLTVAGLIKLAPVMVTVLSKPDAEGVKELMLGVAAHVKTPVLDADPPGVATFTSPVAPAPTTALIVVGLTTVADSAFTPPKLTVTGVAKLEPVIVTVLSSPETVGVKDVTLGIGYQLKVFALVAVPPFVSIVILPVAPLYPGSATSSVLLTISR